jgi:prophage regulatory protein
MVPTRVLRCRGVCQLTALSRSTIYARAKEGTFPAPVKLGPRASGWLESEILQWLDARKAERDATEHRS